MYSHFFEFFGLHENPFSSNGDPAYLFVNHKTQSILDDLTNAIQSGSGLMLLTGEVGTGKTALVNRLVHWLESQRTPTAFIVNPRLEPNELFDLMLSGFGAHLDAHLKGTARQRLNQWLVKRDAVGTSAVLVLDEAQGLPLHVLEEIRLLLNNETAGKKLLQIVLCGQPELEEKLRRPDLRQIRQRVCLRRQMMPLASEETQRYIQKRLSIAGANGTRVFLPEAIEAVHFYARGIPRLVNLLCEHTLINAYTKVIHRVSADIVDEVARQFQFDDVRPIAGFTNEAEFATTIVAEIEPEAPVTAAVAMSSAVAVIAKENADTATHTIMEPHFPGSTVSRPELPSTHVLYLPAKERIGIENATVSESIQAKKADDRKKEVPKTVAGRHSSDLSKRLAAAVKVIPRNVSNSFLSVWLLQLPRELSSIVNSRAWENRAKSALRWLQEPMSTVKVNRRINR